MRWLGGVSRILALLAALILPGSASAQQAAAHPTLATNQDQIGEFRADLNIDISDIGAVFDYVLSQLPPAVIVYPTENYYYFRFYHGGIEYAGNIRLAAVDRDQGIVHFAYFPSANAGTSDGGMNYLPLTAEDGVLLEELGPLEFRVSFRDRSVRFLLNDLSDVRPPDGLLNSNEKYLGPVFDESGIEFFLVFNQDLKIFHYILNETRPVRDELNPVAYTDSIEIGRRTGFAFYRDRRERRILIGILALNVMVNNYYDGPFDQLPDNFIVGDELKAAIEASDPTVLGRINRYGFFDTGAGRYLIGPYAQYSDVKELVQFHLCATDPTNADYLYYGCFATQGGG
jgi:hypothetical protein